VIHSDGTQWWYSVVYVRVCTSVYECVRVCTSVYKCVRVCTSVYECTTGVLLTVVQGVTVMQCVITIPWSVM
jgi:hypothetical protein